MPNNYYSLFMSILTRCVSEEIDVGPIAAEFGRTDSPNILTVKYDSFTSMT